VNCDPACPILAAGASLAENRFNLPVGYLRRVAAVDPEVDETKRNLLKLAAVAGVLGVGVGGAVGGALQYAQPGYVGLTSYPRVQLVDLDGTPLTVSKVESEYNVATSELLIFYYPLRNEPNFLLNLYPANGSPPSASNPGAANVPGGIGTNGSIVAYSAICQHLGCPAPALAWYPPGTCPQTPGGRVFYLHCSCHGSTYDAANSASNLTGPAVLPLPQVVLEKDASGNIFAVGENGPPVNGHLNTLQGDYGVGTSSQLEKETSVILCNIA
jgi:Rieske Fe-S protein